MQKKIKQKRKFIKRRRAEMDIVCANCGAPMRGLLPLIFGVRPSKRKRKWCNRCAPD